MDSAFGFQYSGYLNGGSIFDPKKKGGGAYTWVGNTMSLTVFTNHSGGILF